MNTPSITRHSEWIAPEMQAAGALALRSGLDPDCPLGNWRERVGLQWLFVKYMLILSRPPSHRLNANQFINERSSRFTSQNPYFGCPLHGWYTFRICRSANFAVTQPTFVEFDWTLRSAPQCPNEYLAETIQWESSRT
jgi:hypothetical protein